MTSNNRSHAIKGPGKTIKWWKTPPTEKDSLHPKTHAPLSKHRDALMALGDTAKHYFEALCRTPDPLKAEMDRAIEESDEDMMKFQAWQNGDIQCTIGMLECDLIQE